MDSKRPWIFSTKARSICLVVGLPLGVAALVAAASCSSTPPPTGLAAGCTYNSDCEGTLICAYGRCHAQCKTSKDCNGETCLPPSDVCELPQETACNAMLACVVGLTCADDTCRAPCTPGVANDTTGGCLGSQTCAMISGQNVCIDGSGDGGTGSKDGGSRDSSSSDGHSSDASDSSTADGSDAGACVVPDGSPEAGPLGFVPSNFNPLALLFADGGAMPSDAGVIDWTGAPDTVVKTACGSEVTGGLAGCLGVSPVTITIAKGLPLCEPSCVADLFVLDSLWVQSGAGIDIHQGGIPAPNPIIIAVRTSVLIQGYLQVDGVKDGSLGSTPGAGGYPDPSDTMDLGPGGGSTGGTGAYSTSQPGGGAFCGSGGKGGVTAPGTAAPGGVPYGTPTLIPLLGASSGGYTNAGLGPNNEPGAGGGGLQVSAGSFITVSSDGYIGANGDGYYGGGGAGGAILLEAPIITVDGVVVANGGGGGSGPPTVLAGQSGHPNDSVALGVYDGGNGGAGSTVNGTSGATITLDGSTYAGGGGGGAGWIRFNTACGPTITLDSGSTFVSPSLGSPCTSLGTIKY